MYAPQNEEDKNAYLNNINAVKEFEKEKLREIKGLDNARQTRAAQAPVALTQPVRTQPARTSGGGGIGMG